MRGPSYGQYNQTGSVFNEVCAKEVHCNFTLSHKGGNAHINLKCSKEEIKER